MAEKLGAGDAFPALTSSSGPIGRMDPADVIRLINFYDKQAPK